MNYICFILLIFHTFVCFILLIICRISHTFNQDYTQSHTNKRCLLHTFICFKLLSVSYIVSVSCFYLFHTFICFVLLIICHTSFILLIRITHRAIQANYAFLILSSVSYLYLFLTFYLFHTFICFILLIRIAYRGNYSCESELYIFVSTFCSCN